jgi:hypothetical protein
MGLTDPSGVSQGKMLGSGQDLVAATVLAIHVPAFRA